MASLEATELVAAMEAVAEPLEAETLATEFVPMMEEAAMAEAPVETSAVEAAVKTAVPKSAVESATVKPAVTAESSVAAEAAPDRNDMRRCGAGRRRR